MVKEFVFNNTATVHANSIEEAKGYLFSILKINNDVEDLRRIAEKERQFGSLKYWNTYTENEVDSITEMDYEKVRTYIGLDELRIEDAPYVNDIRPYIGQGLASLPISIARKYDSYKEKMSKIEVPSMSYWFI